MSKISISHNTANLSDKESTCLIQQHVSTLN